MVERGRSVYANGKERVWWGLGLTRTLGLEFPLKRIAGMVLVLLPRQGVEDSKYHRPLQRAEQ